MAAEKSKLADLLRDDPSGRPAAPEHLTLKGILADIGKEAMHQAGAGAHELGAALLREHDGFVMYPRQPEGVEQSSPATPEPSSGREL